MMQSRNCLYTIPFLLTCCAFGQNIGFEDLKNSKQWNLVFEDSCTGDWTENWTLDGSIATLENTAEGMHFKAGPEAGNDAHHAVLWTKGSFKGNIKIEYEYERTDTAIRWVNLLYIQATGDGENGYVSDISKWSGLREIPAMKKYYENMNLLHISYAAFNNNGDGTYYVRARRYPKPNNQSFESTRILPSYDQQGYVETGQTYKITVIKTDTQLFFRMQSQDGEELYEWDLSEIEPLTHGRIGLRHMHTRSALYRNFKVYSK